MDFPQLQLRRAPELHSLPVDLCRDGRATVPGPFNRGHVRLRLRCAPFGGGANVIGHFGRALADEDLAVGGGKDHLSVLAIDAGKIKVVPSGW